MREFLHSKSRGVNWALLLLAFALALLLWGYVTVQDNPVIESRFEVPIDYVNLPEGLALSDKPDAVQVRVSATANVMSGISATDINVYADLAAASEGRYTAPLRFSLPDNVELVSADSTEAVLVIDELATAQRPVSVRYAPGSVADGYMTLAESLLPGQVMLSGSADRLEQVAEVYVTVDVSGAAANFRSSLPVNVVDAGGHSLLDFITPQPGSIDVLVPVVTEQPSRVVPVSVTLSGVPAEGYIISRIVVDPAVVTLFGAQSVLDTVNYAYTSAVNISGARSSVTQEVSLLNVDGISYEGSRNYRAVVTIEPEAVRTIDDVAITLVNQQPAFNYELGDLTCAVTLRGPSSVVRELTAADIEARVDVDSLGAGRHNLAIRAFTSANATVDGSEPISIPVTITAK